jgi:hypothetical protein
MVDLSWKGSTAVAVGRMVRRGVRGSGELTPLTERLLPLSVRSDSANGWMGIGRLKTGRVAITGGGYLAPVVSSYF